MMYKVIMFGHGNQQMVEVVQVLMIAFNFGQDSTDLGAASLQHKPDASGLGQFYTTVPDANKCLCTPNVTTEIRCSCKNHKDFLIIYLYSGTWIYSIKVLLVLNFKPDFVWIKM